MRRTLLTFGFCALASAAAQPAAVAADAGWHVVVSSSNNGIALPQLPTGHYPFGVALGDRGGGTMGFQLAPSTGLYADGNWLLRGSVLAPYAQVGATGALGPGRSGAESTHVFRGLYYGDSIGEGPRAFGATANDPADSPDDASQGIWLWDGTRNVEVARLGRDDVLGPGLGSGVVYKSLHNVDSADDIDVRSLPNRRVLFAGRIGTDSTLGSDGLSVYTPGSGNTPCLLQGSTDPSLSPGLGASTFAGISPSFAVSPLGEVYSYAYLAANGTGLSDGIWQLCDGAPRAAVLSGVSDAYGPGLGDTAVFGGDGNGLRSFLAPSLPGSFYFTSGGRMSTTSGAPTFLGLFHHDGAQHRNVPIMLDNSEGTYGPQIAGYVFHTAVVPYSVRAAGKYAALLTDMSPVGNSSSFTGGLWRLSADGTIEPVAISGDTAAYAPAAGRIWNGTYYRFAVFDNGDIVTLADTKNTANSTTAISWWRLSRGAAPVEILKVGDTVQVPTPSGVVGKVVTDIDPTYVIGLPSLAGRDTFFTANGDILTSDLTIQDFSNTTIVVRGAVARPDYLFASGND